MSAARKAKLAVVPMPVKLLPTASYVANYREILTMSKTKLAELTEWFVMLAWESNEGSVSDPQDVVRGLALVRAIASEVDEVADGLDVYTYDDAKGNG